MVYSAMRKGTVFFLTEKLNPVVYSVLSEETVLVLLTEKFNPVVYGVFSCEETVLVIFDGGV